MAAEHLWPFSHLKYCDCKHFYPFHLIFPFSFLCAVLISLKKVPTKNQLLWSKIPANKKEHSLFKKKKKKRIDKQESLSNLWPNKRKIER